MRRALMVFVGLALLALMSCTPQTLPTPTPSPIPMTSPTPTGLVGGLLATFDVQGERFSVWVTDPAAAQQVLDLQQGRSAASIPNGRILRGPGQAGHNAPWTWHLDPQDFGMAEVTIEVCDSMPSYVEAHRDEFVERVQRYCPWSARLVEVQDYR